MVTIRDAIAADAPFIAAIYAHYILHSSVTFEEQVVDDLEIARRIADLQSLSLPWLVACLDGVVIGYAYASKWRVRHAYRFSVESSIYLTPGYERRGFGVALYRALIDAVTRSGHHVLIGGVALPNAASVALHEKLGFTQVARFSEVGFKFGRWIDVGYWELKLG